MKKSFIIYKSLFESILNSSDQFEIARPTNSQSKNRKINQDQQAKRRKLEIDPLDRYHVLYNEIVKVFVYHLSEKFDSESYKPLMAISTLLTSLDKPDLSDLFFDLNIYRKEYNFDELDGEISIWYDFK